MGHSHSASAEDLLQHLSWAKALARHLVADESTAEDIVQESMVAAMERPPRIEDSGSEGLRPWLGSVLRNVARQRGRSEGRRARREQEATSLEALPSTLELTVRAESQKLLLDALLALDEDARMLVLLRYDEGLSAAEIARRTGRVDATVRSSIKRALDRLRAELDRRHGGDRSAWHAAIAPLLGKATVRRATAVGASSGTLLFWSVLVAAGAAVALGLVALTLLGGFSPEPAQTIGAPVQPLKSFGPSGLDQAVVGIERTALDAERSSAEVAGEWVESGLIPVDAPLFGEVRARFVTADAHPIPKVIVESRAADPAASDQDGRVALSVELRRSGTRLPLRVYAFGFAADVIVARVGAGGTTDLGDLVLTPGGDILGRVVDKEGHPCIGLSVETSGRMRAGTFMGGVGAVSVTALGRTSAVTDDDGRFRLRGVCAGPVDVRVSSENDVWSGEAGAVPVTAGTQTEEIVIVAHEADPEARIEGVVLDHEGNPVPNAYAATKWGSFFFKQRGFTEANAEGHFTCVVDPGARVDMHFRNGGGGLAIVSLEDVEAGTRDLVIRLPEPRTRTVTVLDDRGAPVELARIYVRMDGGGAGERITGEDGTTQLGLSSQALTLEVSAVGCRDQAIKCPATPPERWSAEEPIEITLRRIAQLRGHLAFDGQPIRSGEVSVHRIATRRVLTANLPSRVDHGVIAEGRSDAHGQFALTLGSDGEFLLRVDSEGLAPLEYGPFRYSMDAGLDVGTLELNQGGTLVGRVLDGDQVQQIHVVLMTRGDGVVRTVETSLDGDYRFDHVATGPCFVRVVPKRVAPRGAGSWSGPGLPFRAIEGDTMVSEGVLTRYDIQAGAMAPTAVLRGRIQCESFDATRLRATLTPLFGDQASGEYEASASVAASGEFIVRGGAPGRYVLTLRDASEVARGNVLRIGAFIELGAGENEWAATLSFGRVQTGEHADPKAESLFWEGPGGLMAFAPLAEIDRDRAFPSGKVHRVTQLSAIEALALEDPERVLKVETRRLAAGSTVTLGQ